MFMKPKMLAAFVTMAVLGVFVGPSTMFRAAANAKPLRSIVASDTILSGMLSSLLPPGRYSTEAILPPGQCPGHYDVKLSDIERVKKADLIVSFKGMPFMAKPESGKKQLLQVDAGGRNWMAPDSYIHGLATLAQALSQRYPEDL